MAWRDSRRARGRLLMFSASIMAGIAALVAIASLRDSLLMALENEARGMLGGDVFLQAKRPFSERAERILTGSGARIQRETSSTLMARAAATKSSRLVEARAVDPDYPFHGRPITDPPEAWERCLAGEGFVADPALPEQLGAPVGTVLTLGKLERPLLGTFVRPPPQVSPLGIFAPQLCFARRLAGEAGVGTTIGLTFHRAFLLFPDGFDVEKEFAEKQRRPLRSEGLSMETLEGRKRSVRRVLEVVYSFLSLMAFIALMLGGVGIAGAMQVHALERLPVVATLRCMGCTAGRALAVYLLQGLWLGLAGAAGGVLIGVGVTLLIPWILNRILPVTVSAHFAAGTIWMGLGFGFILCASFALLPLLRVRRVSAMAAVRAPITGGDRILTDPAAWFLIPAVLASLTWLAIRLSPEGAWPVGVGFVVAMLAGLLVLAGTALVIMKLVRWIVRPSWPFPIRQGLAGLHRPRNQTLLFLTTVGLGTSLILSTVQVQHLLTRFFDGDLFRGKPNFFVIDAKPDQRAAIEDVVARSGARMAAAAPVVLLSLAALDGRSLDEVQQEERGRRPGGWFLTNTYRASWNRELMGAAPPPAPGATVPVSIEEGLLSQLKLKVGQSVTFRSDDRELVCVIQRTHAPSFENLLQSFPVIFPEGALEGFRHSWGFAVRTVGLTDGVRLQRDLTAAVPGVTVFDLATLTSVIEDLLDRGLWVIRALSLLTVFTGCVIVVAILLSGRRDRLEESVLLRTLGASRSQIRRILVSEHVLLGLLASLTGGLLATGYAWLLARFLFKVPFSTVLWPLAAAVAVVCALTLALGLLLGRGIASHPPLAILRGAD